jgi:hypothetical protein
VSGRRISLAVLVVASAVALAGVVPGTPGGSLAFGLAVMAFPPALIAFAVARRGRVGSLRVPLLLFAGLLQLCVLAMLALSGRSDDGVAWLGLPPATAVMLYGLWLAPLLFVSWIHARHFDRAGLTEEDLLRLQELARRNRGER